MKKIIFAMFIVTMLVTSCTKKPDFVPVSSTTTAEKDTEESEQNTTSTEGTNEALTLMKGSDCFACHKADSKLLGPSWQEIANKYTTSDVQTLANHVIDGSTGIWGELQMTPHPAISIDDAKKMVEYILTLKTN